MPGRMELADKYYYDTTYYSIPLPAFIASSIAKADEIMRENEKQNQQAILDAETREIVEHEYRTRKREMIDNFLSSTVCAIRYHIKELCESIITYVTVSGKKINKSHCRRIDNLINQVRLLNFYDDKEMEGVMNDLKRQVANFYRDKDDQIIVRSLRRLVDVVSDEYIPEDFVPAFDFLDLD
jgi:hypothetical protein